jgi:hypothetical protein
MYASINSYEISPGCRNAHWSRRIAALGSTVRTCSYDIFHVVNTILFACLRSQSCQCLTADDFKDGQFLLLQADLAN